MTGLISWRSTKVLIGFLIAGQTLWIRADTWTVDSKKQWNEIKAHTSNISLEDGFATPSADTGLFRSRVKTFEKARKAKSIIFEQSPVWDNWKQIDDITPAGLGNAYVFLPVAPGDYYVLATKKDNVKIPAGLTKKEKKDYRKKHGSKGGGGYHAWHSTDLKTWKHCGPVSQSKWVTTAEYADGKFYIYYDKPNDQDPHLIIDENLKDGIIGKEMGMAFSDPSHGSDAAIFRDEDGTFHLIYEDWTPINARKHAWDSPLAGHTSSPDGFNGFTPHKHPFPIDHRTKPTGKVGEYRHGATSKKPLKYDIHEPEQNAYGDFTMIKVGRQYHLFCDFDPAESGKSMRMGRFTTDDLNKEFTWSGEIGEGFHPDPSVGFAEGKFYVVMQKDTDFESPGPWVDGIDARVGVDINGNGKIDQWTKWTRVNESYSQKPGFARIVDVKPAQIDLRALPEGKGFAFEFKTTRLPSNGVQPIMNRVEVNFE